MSLKSLVFNKLGYHKMENKHQISNHIDAQKQLLKNRTAPLIFDVGANVGQTAKYYRSKFPKSVIHSFEPAPETFQELKNRFLSDKLIVPHQLALSDQIGHMSFYLNKNCATNSLLPSCSEGVLWAPPGSLENIEKLTIPTMTLDHFCRKEGISHIDILKMDAQGGELMILKGAHELLSKGSIDVIYSEVLFVPLYKDQANYHDLSLFLSSYGYTVFDIFNRRHAPNGQVKWADAIFFKHRNAL